MQTTTNSRISLLLVEDNPADIRLIQEVLHEYREAAFQHLELVYEHVTTLADAKKALDSQPFDLILLDLSLPDSQALNTFKSVHTYASDIPIIILSGLASESLAVQALQKGAQDYMIKDEISSGGILARSIRHAIERHRLLEQLEEKSKALQVSEANRRKIIETNADGIIIMDKQGIVRFVNPAAEEILRSEKESLIGQKFQLPDMTKETAEFRVQRRQGGSATLQMRLAEIEWEGEKMYQGSLRDISQLKAETSRIQQKAEKLTVQNLELDEFAHTMAHQIQGLLSQMIGYASFVEMNFAEDLHADILMSLQRIVQSGNKMNNVINELLLLASMNTDDIPLVPLDMTYVVKEVLKRLRFQIKESEAEIKMAKQWPVPLGHQSWIEEALVNYVNNAIKYGGSPPKIDIGANISKAGMIYVWVRDNGAGIEPADQDRLFKAHTRLHQVRARGEGLGLSIVKRIIYRCGGEVGVKSQIGQGSIFWFTLPNAEPAKESLLLNDTEAFIDHIPSNSPFG